VKTRQELLTEIRESLHSGLLSESDLRAFITTPPTAEVQKLDEKKQNKLSAVDIMFYIAGIVLFSTIMSVIIQSWDDDNPFTHILLSAVIGAGLWVIAYQLMKSAVQSDIRKGLISALLLTGSLLIIVGGYIITNELIGGFSEVNFIAGAFTLLALGGLHIGFDRVVKRNLTLLMGVLLAVASFPALLFGVLQDSMTLDIWSIILVMAAGLLVYATRVVARITPERAKIANSFDSFAAFLALLSIYIAGYGDYGVLWLCALIAAVLGLFYLSIVLQNKHLLGNASFFMVLAIITISFKYFSGYGITFSLIIATFGLLGSAAVASSINKKYFK